MSNIARKGIRYLQRLNASNVSTSMLEKGMPSLLLSVIFSVVFLLHDAMFYIGDFHYKLYKKGELMRALGGAIACPSLLGVPLGHNSSFLQRPAFAPPRIREAIWCGSTNSSTEGGKELEDPQVLTDVGDVPIREIRDCGVNDDRLMNVINESVKLVMEEAPLRPLVLDGNHSISYPVVRAVSEKLGGPVDILYLDAHLDIYHCFEGNKYSVGIRSIIIEGRERGKKFRIEQYEMRIFFQEIVYISIDVDCLDPAFAPGMSYIKLRGLSFCDVLNILHNLQGDIVTTDVVEFNLQRDTVDSMNVIVAAKLVRELTAKIAK
ncbi:hypothetical protein AAHE18_18G163100 [Arachis hypogaea]